jgi:hypothetical protein
MAESTPGTDLPILKEASTWGMAFRRLAAKHPDRVAVRTVDDRVSITWGALRERVDALAGGLAGLGLGRGDTIALMLSNRPDFHLVDLAATSTGATPFSIYQTLAPEQIEYVVSDAGARIAIIERAYFDVFMKARARLPALEHVIVVDGAGESGTLRLGEVEGANPDFDVEASCAAVSPEDLLTLIYTSGTTGPPKGVQLSHRNLFSVIAAIVEGADLPAEGRVISWLPTAHIAERALNYYLPLTLGGTITTCPDPAEIVSYLPQVRGTGGAARRAARGRARSHAGGPPRRDREAAAGPGREAGVARAGRACGRGRPRALLGAATDARPRPGRGRHRRRRPHAPRRARVLSRRGQAIATSRRRPPRRSTRRAGWPLATSARSMPTAT